MNPATKNSTADLQLAFDVGHSSIGWAVLQAQHGQAPALLGCGSVIFPADDCLASERRGFRRQRRHIRATRLRIARMKRLLAHLGVLPQTQLDAPGCAWPWLLAARVLRGGKKLTWSELWDVLRWYAHNRGYDGNKGWSRDEQDSAARKDDTDKVKAALALYEKHGTHTMSETWCSVCGLDPLGVKRSVNLQGSERPRGLNAAFPREDVEAEVERIVRAHVEGRRWAAIPPILKKNPMSNITINVSSLTLLQKLARGQDIITKSTSNPEVPGNATMLAAFVAAQSALTAADAAVEAHRTAGALLMDERALALDAWLATLTGLAAFTESATGGDSTKILSAGFGVRGAPVPPQPVSQVLNVRVGFTGVPGKSEVRWKRDPNADAYVLECCQDPIVDSEWEYMGTTPEPKFLGNGAIPGKRCWYRVGGVNRLGQGPWSEPALRPVM